MLKFKISIPRIFLIGSSLILPSILDLTCALMLEASPCTLNCIDLMVNISLCEYCFLIFAIFHILVAEHPGDGGVKLPEAVLSAKKVQFDAFRLTGFVDFIKFGFSNVFSTGLGPLRESFKSPWIAPIGLMTLSPS